MLPCTETSSSPKEAGILFTIPNGIEVVGMAVMTGQVFLVRDRLPIIEVYESDTLTLQLRLALNVLLRPRDMTSSAKFCCLYVVDVNECTYKGKIVTIPSMLGCTKSSVYRIELNGNSKSWSVNEKIYGISMSICSCNVIAACDASSSLKA